MPDLKKIDVAFSNKETTNELKFYNPAESNEIKVLDLKASIAPLGCSTK